MNKIFFKLKMNQSLDLWPLTIVPIKYNNHKDSLKCMGNFNFRGKITCIIIGSPPARGCSERLLLLHFSPSFTSKILPIEFYIKATASLTVTPSVSTVYVY